MDGDALIEALMWERDEIRHAGASTGSQCKEGQGVWLSLNPCTHVLHLACFNSLQFQPNCAVTEECCLLMLLQEALVLEPGWQQVRLTKGAASVGRCWYRCSELSAQSIAGRCGAQATAGESTAGGSAGEGSAQGGAGQG